MTLSTATLDEGEALADELDDMIAPEYIDGRPGITARERTLEAAAACLRTLIAAARQAQDNAKDAGRIHELLAELDRENDRADEAEADRDAAVAMLRTHGRHTDMCRVTLTETYKPGVCDCGLDAAIAAATPGKGDAT